MKKKNAFLGFVVTWKCGFLWAVMLLLVLKGPPASGFEFKLGENMTGHFDNTIKYSTICRLHTQESALIDASKVNNDDGDRNFNRGFVSNRMDLLSELDIASGQSYGLRVSGAAWYDTVYNTDNDNDSPATNNSFSVPHDEFTDDTEKLHGRKVELLDGLIWGNTRLADMPANIRAGRHSLIWGESLFFGSNGIMAGQSPRDIIKLISVPNSQAKEHVMPVTQASGQIQVNPDLAFAAYYQFEWRENRIPAVGSYFSTVDLLDEGGERLLVAGRNGFFRRGDDEARDNGQWGISARFRIPWTDFDYGLYYLKYHDHAPQLYLKPGSNVDLTRGKIGEYYLVYPEDISILGASFGGEIGGANVSGEFHIRKDMPLQSTPQAVLPGMKADNRDNPLYAVGDTAHANISGTYSLAPTLLWEGGIVLAEVAWNRYLSVDQNRNARNDSLSHDALAFRMVFTPSYYQVLPALDISVPIGLGYSPQGKSSVVANFASDDGGDFSIGTTAIYRNLWTCSLNYTNYWGPKKNQSLEDRDFISFSIQRTF